jgi:threonine dehydrogenase-like Zn-dependent dehydrogenase
MDEFNGVRKHSYDWVYEFFKKGEWDVSGLITHRFPLSAYKEAIRLASAPKGGEKAIKIIFEHEK